MATNSMTYNGLDTRVGMTDSSGSRTFKRAGIGVTSPVLSDGSASFTLSGENRAGVKTAYHGGLKSFDLQTNSAQAVVGQRLTDAFGNQISSSGVWKGRFAYGGPHGYQEDPDTGLRLLGHRHYDSSTGRFLTRDPIKDGRNWYVYCGNDPVGKADPKGLAYHDPSQVSVDPGFQGTVVAYGDLPGRNDPRTGKWRPWRDSDGWRMVPVPSGYETDPIFDVDLIVVTDKDGKMTLWWIPGNLPGGGSSKYHVNADGTVSIVSAQFPAMRTDDIEALRNLAVLFHPPSALLIALFILNCDRMWPDWIEKAGATGFPIEFTPTPIKK